MRKLIKGMCLLLSLIMLFSGCRSVPVSPDDTAALQNYTPIQQNIRYYDNYQFNAYQNPQGAAEHLPDQGIYGSGNAYILRYNGLYYMYMGTSNMGTSALPCWQSEDLMHWAPVDNGINEKGTIADDPRLDYTYPPCVKQFNGTFYMYLYIKNNLVTHGNYILKANSPIGPFTFVTDESGEPVCYTVEDTTLNIDCDIFIDDNEDVYFMSGYADENFIGIRAFEMPSMESVSYDEDSWINLVGTHVGGWTEGNGIFKRNGNYYLMYTGSDILKPGYLTHYSVAVDGSWKNAFGAYNHAYASGFEMGLDWPMGCETQENFYSLGHATSILGPDMDGIYYHYFSVNGVGPNCSFAIDRLIFNGAGMDTAQTQFHSVAPQRPAIYSYAPFSSEQFSAQDGSLLSVNASAATFTAEFNFVGSDVICVVGYTDRNNYAYVITDLAAKQIHLYTITDGTATAVATGTIVRDYDAAGLLQTIRVAYRDGKADVYFDDLLKIENAAVEINPGRIGYISGGDFEAGYTACSNVAKGLSDAIEPKQAYINIGAESYLPSGVFEGHGSVFSAGNGYSTVEKGEYGSQYVGLGKMTLSAKTDQASYLVDFSQAGNYGLQMTFNRAYAGKTIGIRIDGGEMQVFTLPKTTPTDSSDIIKATVCTLWVEAGIHEVTFYGRGEAYSFHSFTFVRSASTEYRHSEQQTLSLPGSDRQILWVGDENLQNYTLDCDFRLDGDSDATAGILVHGARYSDSQWVEEFYWSMQGYYIAFNRQYARLEKLNYSFSDLNVVTENFTLQPDVWYRATITVSGNTVTASITSPTNQNILLSFTDSIVLGGGQVGLYTTGQAISFQNITIVVQ